MTKPNIPRIAGIDPKVAKILGPMKEILEDLAGGTSRAVRQSDFARGTFQTTTDGKLELIVAPSVLPAIQQRIEQLEAVQTDISTLAEELFGTAQFGSLLASGAWDAKTLTTNVNGHIAGYSVAVHGGAAGEITSDFIIQADRFAIVFPAPPWLQNQAYSLGQYVTPTKFVANFIYEVTTAGTTGSTEPTWPTTPGNTVASGTVVFTCRTIDERVPFVVGMVGGVATVGIDGNLLVDGTIEAVAIAAGSITTDKLAAQAVTAEKLSVNIAYAGEIVISTDGVIRSGQTDYDTGTGWWLGNDGGTPKFSIGDDGGNKVTWNGAVLTVIGEVSGALDAASIVGTIPPEAFDISTIGWTIDFTFSADDANTVSWTAGTLYTAAGDTYAIDAGDTGNMTDRTYIFLDINVSITDLQLTTTAGDAVGAGRVLIAVAEDDTTTAFFQVFGGSGSFGASSPDIPSFGVIANGDFETNSAVGWSTDSSWAIVTETPIVGTYAARIATSSTGLRSDSFPAAPGDRFLITCVAKRDEGSVPDGVLRLEVLWSPSGNFSSELATAAQGSSGVQFLRIAAVVPANQVSGRVVIRKSAGASGHWFADDVFATPLARSSDIALSGVTGTIDLATQVAGTLSTAFAAAGLINTNVTINANGTLSGAGGGQASLTSLPGAVSLATQVSDTLSTAFAAAGLINTNVTVNANGTLSGAGGGQVSLPSLPGTIAAGQIAANTITGGMIAALTITAGNIAAATITGAKIVAGEITGSHIAALTVTAANIAALTVTAAKIAANTITTNEIAAATITAANIAAATITGSLIAGSTITGSLIAGSTITGDKIVGATITGDKIAANEITGNHIVANAITANHIQAGVITAGKLAASIALVSQALTLSAGATFSSGATNYDSGIGWWLEYNGGVPRLFLGNSAGNKIRWDGAELIITGNVSFTNVAVSFTPSSWSGFSIQPVGQLWYIDFGSHVHIFARANLVGTSNNTDMTLTGLPTNLWPSIQRVVSCMVFSAAMFHGTATINTNGTITFGLSSLLSNRLSLNESGFFSTAQKGLVTGFFISYPKV